MPSRVAKRIVKHTRRFLVPRKENQHREPGALTRLSSAESVADGAGPGGWEGDILLSTLFLLFDLLGVCVTRSGEAEFMNFQ